MKPSFKIIVVFFPYLLVHEQCTGPKKKTQNAHACCYANTHLDQERKVNSINL